MVSEPTTTPSLIHHFHASFFPCLPTVLFPVTPASLTPSGHAPWHLPAPRDHLPACTARFSVPVCLDQSHYKLMRPHCDTQTHTHIHTPVCTAVHGGRNGGGVYQIFRPWHDLYVLLLHHHPPFTSQLWTNGPPSKSRQIGPVVGDSSPPCHRQLHSVQHTPCCTCKGQPLRRTVFYMYWQHLLSRCKLFSDNVLLFNCFLLYQKSEVRTR